MQVSFASVPGSGTGRINEDWVGATGSVAVVLDGVSSPQELGTGCIHDVPWYVENLGSRLLGRVTTWTQSDLPTCLETAIRDVSDLHRDTCNLNNQGTPSATVAVLRQGSESWEYLVLSDAVLIAQGDKGMTVITDDRVTKVVQDEVRAVHQEIPGTPQHRDMLLHLVTAQRRYRNREDGYWLAGAIPEAAHRAVTGTLGTDGIQRAALMTDGVSCLVDTYHQWTWKQLLDAMATQGPCAVLRQVRETESRDPYGKRWPRYKASDDATAAFISAM